MSVSHAAGENLSRIGTAQAATSSAAEVPQPRLVKAAHEFEAALMKELMAPLVPGGDSLESGADSGSNSALSSFAGEALGKALSERGGFGIATRIIHQLSSNHSGNATVPKQSRLSATHVVSQ